MAKKAETVTAGQNSLALRHEYGNLRHPMKRASGQVYQTVSSNPIEASTSSLQTRDRSCLIKKMLPRQ